MDFFLRHKGDILYFGAMSVGQRFCYLLLLCSLPIGFAGAQEFAFANVNERLALPSLECYNILQDSRGYLWIGTEQGLVRYNGNSSQVFGTGGGLPEKAVYASLEYPKGKLWFASSANRLLTFGSGKLTELPVSSAYQKLMAMQVQPNYTFAIIPQGNRLFVNSSRILAMVDTCAGKVAAAAERPKVNELQLQFFGDRLIPYRYQLQFRRGKDGIPLLKQVPISIGADGGTKRMALPLVNEGHWRILTASNRQGHFFSYDDKLVWLRRDGSHRSYAHQGQIISLYADGQGGIWVGAMKKGVHYYDFSRSEKAMVSLSGYSVSGTCQDREGSIWCTTLEEGVFMLASKQVISHGYTTRASVLPSLLDQVDGKLWISSAGQGIQVLDSISGKFVPFISSRHTFHHVWADPRNWFLASEAGVYQVGRKNRAIAKREYGGKWDPVLASPLGAAGERYLLTFNNIFVYPANSGMYSQIYWLKSMSRSLQYLNAKQLLMGGGNGLFLIDIPSGKSTRLGQVGQGVSKIIPDGRGGMWVCSRSDGLFYYRDGKLRHMDGLLKLPATVFYDMVEDISGNLWIGSHLGLLKIHGKGRGYQTELYQTSHGLPANEVYRVAAYRDRLYFATTKGVASLPLGADMANRVPPQFYLSSVNGRPWPRDSTISLGYGDNQLSIGFDVLQFRGRRPKIYYTLNTGKRPIQVQDTAIQLQQLAPGRYGLSAYAVNSDGLPSREKVKLTIVVASPFWQTWWFVSGVALFFVLLFWALKNRQVNKVKEREREQGRIQSLIAESRLSALQAQMNPHFIFNAINSIQGYILDRQADRARNYLTKFSRLIRLILQQSRQRFVALEQEIQTLKLYVELEQMRFDEAFGFELEVDPSLDVYELQVPAMLVQPYVENAIWHGLMNLKGQRRGKLEIGFSAQGAELCIVIADNGIGRSAAGQLARDAHYVSSGILLTEDRLKVLGELYGQQRFELQIEDLERDGVAMGTRVTLTLSMMNEEQLG